MRKEPPKINHPYVFSVSQIETFLLCPRKWAYDKIDGLADPGNEASILGGKTHDQLEKYLEKGTPINMKLPEGKIAFAALPHLPPPMYPGMRIEEWFHFRIGSAYVRGLKDVEIPGGWKSKNPFLSDHKTTKNFIWAKSAEDLTGGVSGVGDIQAGVYSKHTMEETRKEIVDLQWTYIRTTGAPLAQPTKTIITLDQVDRILVGVERTIEEMIETKLKHKTALTVIQKPTGCDAFGGCPRKALCALSPAQKFKAMMSQKTKEQEKMSDKKSVLESLAKRKAAKSGTKTESAKKPATPKTQVVETEATDAEINPPENAYSPEVTEEDAKNRGKKTRAKNTAVVTSLESGGSLFGRAVDAFLDVFVQEVANRVKDQLKK
jgi:hypothetical protein